MSWLFSRALVEESLGESSSGGTPSAQLSVMPTQHKFWRNDKTMEHSRLSQFGLTCAVLTESRGEELLTSFREGFRAKTSLQPAEGQESTEHAQGSGVNLRGSFAKYVPDLRLWKIPQGSLLEDYTEFSETWPKWGMTVDGAAFRLKTPSGLEEFRRSFTVGSGFGFVRAPTPRAQDGKHGAVSATDTTQRRVIEGTANLCEWIQESVRVPTPTATDAMKWNRKTAEQRRKQGSSVRIGNVVTDAKGKPAGGALNPPWVEWLMGWPIGWTDCTPLATDKFQQWLHSHGGC